jgi:hypothetical protein
MSEVHKNYLQDLGYLLRERAVEATQSARTSKGTDDEAYQLGRKMAYYEVISLLVQQAESFQLPIEDLHLEGLDNWRPKRSASINLQNSERNYESKS